MTTCAPEGTQIGAQVYRWVPGWVNIVVPKWISRRVSRKVHIYSAQMDTQISTCMVPRWIARWVPSGKYGHDEVMLYLAMLFNDQESVQKANHSNLRPNSTTKRMAHYKSYRRENCDSLIYITGDYIQVSVNQYQQQYSLS